MENTAKNPTEQWYRIPCDKKTNENGYIEYSMNFDFFMQNQICFHPNANGLPYIFSTLDGKVLYKFDTMESWDDDAILKRCQTVHNKVLNGEFGQGQIIE